MIKERPSVNPTMDRSAMNNSIRKMKKTRSMSRCRLACLCHLCIMIACRSQSATWLLSSSSGDKHAGLLA